jgi:hypothetical protein
MHRGEGPLTQKGPSIDVVVTVTAAKIRGRAAGASAAGAICRFNIIDKVAQPPSGGDKQMPNTASALLDTVTKSAIAVKG